MVWERRARSGSEKIIEGIYSAFVKRKANGHFIPKKPMALRRYADSTGDFDINYQNPDVAFNPDRNEYLVVYASGTCEVAFA